jgi:hypothetical protein
MRHLACVNVHVYVCVCVLCIGYTYMHIIETGMRTDIVAAGSLFHAYKVPYYEQQHNFYMR